MSNQHHPAHQPEPANPEPTVQVDVQLHTFGIDGKILTRKTGTRQFLLIDISHDTPTPGDVHMTVTSSVIGDTPTDIADFLRDTAEYLAVMTTSEDADGEPTP